MPTDDIFTYRDAKADLGLKYVTTVTDLVAMLEIETKPVRRNGKAKGLDRAAMRKLRKALGLARAS